MNTLDKETKDYVLPLLKLFSKLDSKEDFTAECAQIKVLPPDQVSEVIHQLFNRLGKEGDDAVTADAIRQIGSVADDYLNDFVEMIQARSDTDVTLRRNFIAKIINRPKPYTNPILLNNFVRGLSFMAINLNDKDLLVKLIHKIESNSL